MEHSMKEEKSILLIEDDAIDIMAVKRAVKELNISNPLKTVGNGEEALIYLRDVQHDMPGIILLDLNMPRMNGIEFLQIAKNDNSLKRIPVIVLTTSQEQQDKVQSFNFSVAGYMTKPIDYLKFVEIIHTIHLYWTISELPE